MKVKEIKRRGEYNPATDYWKDFRDAVVTMHRENKDIVTLRNYRSKTAKNELQKTCRELPKILGLKRNGLVSSA